MNYVFSIELNKKSIRDNEMVKVETKIEEN